MPITLQCFLFIDSIFMINSMYASIHCFNRKYANECFNVYVLDLLISFGYFPSPSHPGLLGYPSSFSYFSNPSQQRWLHHQQQQQQSNVIMDYVSGIW